MSFCAVRGCLYFWVAPPQFLHSTLAYKPWFSSQRIPNAVSCLPVRVYRGSTGLPIRAAIMNWGEKGLVHLPPVRLWFVLSSSARPFKPELFGNSMSKYFAAIDLRISVRSTVGIKKTDAPTNTLKIRKEDTMPGIPEIKKAQSLEGHVLCITSYSLTLLMNSLLNFLRSLSSCFSSWAFSASYSLLRGSVT